MDFFEHQEVARKKTGRLIIFFILGLVGIIALTYVAIIFGLSVSSEGEPIVHNLELLLGVGIGVTAVVGFASLYKISSLSSGGTAVADMLGGRLVDSGARDPLERRLLNVVEEMAIASGTPVPQVYVMENEPGINAFAAGFSPSDAVIGVTRGCLENLDRDQLQGVIGHEFSHILNGDMRMNIRLMGVIFGILAIGLIGRIILRSSMYSRRRKDSGGALAMGLAFLIIGYVGMFFGNLIKAAVSRQREYLADASAVQFTRNPEGIAGALKRIGGLEEGSNIHNPAAEEASHMFFGAGFSGLFATHPPLEERIERIQAYPLELASSPAQGASALPAGASGFAGQTSIAATGPSEQHVKYAKSIIADMPVLLSDASHEPFSARAVVYALLLSNDAEIAAKQRKSLTHGAQDGVYELTARYQSDVAKLPRRSHLPLLDMTLPALRSLSAQQYKIFRANLQHLIRADNKIDLFEWTISRIVIQGLDEHFGLLKPAKAKHRSLSGLRHPFEIVLSTMAYVGAKKADAAENAYIRGIEQIGWQRSKIRPNTECTLTGVGNALDLLRESTPKIKGQLLRGCATVAEDDGRITVREAELIRAIADAVGTPVPPMMNTTS